MQTCRCALIAWRPHDARTEIYAFYKFCCRFRLKLLTFQSLPHKLFGWYHAEYLIKASLSRRPPAKRFLFLEPGSPLLMMITSIREKSRRMDTPCTKRKLLMCERFRDGKGRRRQEDGFISMHYARSTDTW